ncbi:AzlC family ABC transporter permease [Kribbella sp. NPDC026611]|uniref:AzlC family ABC transporter permease n=1 Tax=Kribbella sp. NPDC026611 TaxID=3154911 RepID=UPI0033FB7EFA
MQLPRGVIDSVPVAVATAPVGITFGVLAEPVFGAWPAVLMSMLMWSGGAQFAVLSVLSGGGSLLLAGTAATVTNARYLPMGFAIAPSMGRSLIGRVLTGALVVDASFVIARRDNGRFDINAIAWAAPLQYAAWVGGTAVGVIGAGSLGDPDRLGLDVMFPVFFLGLLLPELRGPNWRALLVACLAAVIALALTPITPTGVPVIAGALTALIGLRKEHKS